jgi:sulfate permease, SulP family
VTGAAATRTEPPVDVAAWAAAPPAGLRRHVPLAGWLRDYDRRWLVRDLLAGMTVWGIAVPEAMGYAGIAGMPLQAGLYTLLASLLVYAFLGTSRQMVVGATAASASITAAVVAGANPTSTTAYVEMVAIVVIATGVLFVVAGFLKLGFIAVFIPRTVMTGFIFGLGIFVMAKQVYKLFGLPEPSGSTIEILATDVSNLGETHAATAAFGIGAVAVLLLMERFLRKLPAALIVLFAGIALSSLLTLEAHGVEIVGDVPSGLPSVSAPHVEADQLPTLVAGAGGLMLVILSSSLGIAANFAQKHRYPLDTNQELVAQGLTNIASGFLGGLANGGSLSDSSVNDNAGARSAVALLGAWVLMLLTVLFLTPVFTDLPEAVLAAIVIVAVKGLLKLADFRGFWRVSRPEFALGLITLVAVIAWDVLPAMILGVVLAVVTITYRASRSSVSVLARKPGMADAWRDRGRHADWETVPGVMVLRGDAQLFYANGEAMVSQAKRLIGEADPTPRAVVFDAEATRTLDITGEAFMAQLIADLDEAGIHFAFANLNDDDVGFAERAGLGEALDDQHVFLTIDEAVAAMLAHTRPS